MAFTIIVGSKGRMSLELQNLLSAENKDYKIFSPRAPEGRAVGSLDGCEGVIDFSTPEISLQISELARQAKLPYVCGTTGWTDKKATEKKFLKIAEEIPVVWDSNFSQGVEWLCKIGEMLSSELKEPAGIVDIHHRHKKDAPSGTALKIADRLKSESHIQSFRMGEIPGEHRLLFAFGDESLEIVHRASSRKPFAAGALKALEWARKQKPGLYSMKDVLTS